MKIRKIKSIKNVWSFRECEWDTFNKFLKEERQADWTRQKVEKNVEFWKKNILYGDNGNGKSTIVKVFKSLNNDTTVLLKNWDTSWVDQSINIEMDDGSENIFDWTSWNINLQDKFHIFDREFIRNSVGDLHEEIEIEISKKRGEHFFTLGEFKEREQLLADLRNEKNEINIILWSWNDIMNLFSYIEAIKEDTVRSEKKIELEKRLESERQKISDATKRKDNLIAIQKLKIPLEINLDIEAFFEDCKVFPQKLSSLIFSYGEESSVKDIVALIHKHWTGECLVCKQNIKTPEDTYIPRMQELIDTILESSVEEAEKQMNLQLLNIESFLKRIQQFPEIFIEGKKLHSDLLGILKSYWVNTSEYSDISELSFSIEAKENTDIQSLLSLVWEKQKSKSKDIKFDPESIQPILGRLLKTLNLFNKAIQEDKKLLENIQGQNVAWIQSEVDLIELEKWKITLELTLIWNYQRIESFIWMCQNFYDGEKGPTDGNFDLKTCLDKLRIFINKKFNDFVKKYGENIGKYITEINSSISVAFNCSLDGWISNGASRCGFSLIYNGNNIARELSDGEKRVVALWYFFALRWEEIKEYKALQIEISKMQEKLKDPGLSAEERTEISIAKIAPLSHAEKIQKKILVFDDPVTDFDAWHKQIVAIKIDKISDFYEQCLTFTHDEKFKKYLEKSWGLGWWLFAIQKIHTGSIIGPLWKDQIQLYEDDLKSFHTSWTAWEWEYFRIRENVYKLRFCLENWVKNSWLLWEVEGFDRLLAWLSGIQIWAPDQIQTMKEIYKFCNLNGSHEWSCEWYNGLKKNIERYFQLRWISLCITPLEINQSIPIVTP